MNNDTTIKFQPELIKRLNNAMADASVAVAEAALSAVAQDSKLTVRAFATALRACAPMLGTSNTVLSAAVKAAKEKGTTLDYVCAAMADAADRKRRDDAKRASDRRAAAPAKALEKAQKEVAECILAMRTPLEVAKDNVTAAEERVKQVYKLLRDARADLRKARTALAKLVKTDAEAEQAATEQAATEQAATEQAA